MKTRSQCLLATAVLLFAATGMAFAQGTAFRYHGRLNDNGIPASGNYDLTFAVFDADTGNQQVGGSLTNSAVAVDNGLFAVTLDFGTGVFDGRERWLQMGVRPSGTGDFTLLSPRQLLTPTPYAITASNLSGTLEANQLTGTLPASLLGGGQFTRTFIFDNPANSFTGNGAGLSDVDAAELGGLGAGSFWQLGGNAGTTPGVNFLGTTDNQPLELKVNGQRAFRLEPSTNSPNIIGGFQGNYAGSNVIGATIGGGGAVGQVNRVESYSYAGSDTVPNQATIGGGSGNQIASGDHGTIAGGASNSIAGRHFQNIDAAGNEVISGGVNNLLRSASASTIAGGKGNSILGSPEWGWSGTHYSVIGGGISNRIDSFDPRDYSASVSTIAGGSGNLILACSGGTIGGGRGNSLDWHGSGTIAGGSGNYIAGSPYSARGGTVGGGLGNGVYGGYAGVVSGGQNNRARASWSTVAGGYENYLSAFAEYSTIGGGETNTVWGAYAVIPGGRQNSATNYCFAGGRRAKAVEEGAFVWADSNDFDFSSTTTNSFSVRSVGGARFVSGIDPNGTPTSGVELLAGGGSWSSLSGRNAKENFADISPREVLERVNRLSVTTWNYKSQDSAIRHIGPMAQDFAAAFQVGESDRRITTVDADGVALAAIQGLNEIVEEQKAELKQKAAEIHSLQKRLEILERVILGRETAQNGGGE